MKDQIATAPQSVLSDSLSYVLTLLFIQVFVVFQMFWHGSGDYAVRRRFVASLFLPFVVMVVIMLVFIFSHLEDMLRVGHARPRWGTLCLDTWHKRSRRCSFHRLELPR